MMLQKSWLFLVFAVTIVTADGWWDVVRRFVCVLYSTLYCIVLKLSRIFAVWIWKTPNRRWEKASWSTAFCRLSLKGLVTHRTFWIDWSRRSCWWWREPCILCSPDWRMGVCWVIAGRSPNLGRRESTLRLRNLAPCFWHRCPTRGQNCNLPLSMYRKAIQPNNIP